MQLRDYQIEGLDNITRALDAGIDRQLVVWPTGGGKTILFSHLPQRVPGRMLVLAHREELLTQARDKIQWANPQLDVQIEQGNNIATVDADVVVASVPTLGRGSSDRIEKFPSNHFTTVVVDECHHAAAPSYLRVLDHFEPELRLGVTATPQRGDRTRLLDVFDEIVHFKTIQDLIEAGYLCNLAGYRIPTNINISDVNISNGDYAVGQLSSAVNVDSRNRVAVEAYKNIAPGKKAVAFCVDVQHAFDMAEAFRRSGISAATVVGTTPKDERREIFAAFARGDIQVLTNVAVATEGWDEPSLECVILAKPTRSPVVLTQAIGRGTRLFEGKERCLVIDLADATKGKKPMGLPTLMGLPPDFDSEGEDLTEVVQKFKELEEKAPAEAARVKSVRDIREAWENIDLFTPPPANEELMEYTEFVWMETSQDKYTLNLTGGERLTITGDTLGRYAVDHRSPSGNLTRLGGEGYTCKSMDEAFRRTDGWVKQHRSEHLNLINATAAWRNEKPTESQMKWLKKFNAPITADLTKGQASIMLDQLFAANPKKPRSKRQEYAIRAKRGHR